MLDKYLTRYFVYLIFNFDFGLPICAYFAGKKLIIIQIGIIKSQRQAHLCYIYLNSDNLWSHVIPWRFFTLSRDQWRSKIGRSDWTKLIREFIFYPKFERQYLGFLWLDSCDSELVEKPLSRSICVPIFRWIGQIVAEILHSKDWIYYSLLNAHDFYIWLPFFMQTISEDTHRLAHGLSLLL